MPATALSTVYRPRHPKRSDFYEIFEQHFGRYLSVYDERYEPRWGPLRPVARPAVEPFLDCGRLQGRFAGARCERCDAEHLLAISCSCRNFCPSCQAKRAALFAKKLVDEVHEIVHHVENGDDDAFEARAARLTRPPSPALIPTNAPATDGRLPLWPKEPCALDLHRRLCPCPPDPPVPGSSTAREGQTFVHRRGERHRSGTAWRLIERGSAARTQRAPSPRSKLSAIQTRIIHEPCGRNTVSARWPGPSGPLARTRH